jgi:hypothetical protein
MHGSPPASAKSRDYNVRLIRNTGTWLSTVRARAALHIQLSFLKLLLGSLGIDISAVPQQQLRDFAVVVEDGVVEGS